jgi:hypothetical protein
MDLESGHGFIYEGAYIIMPEGTNRKEKSSL